MKKILFIAQIKTTHFFIYSWACTRVLRNYDNQACQNVNSASTIKS